VGAPLQLLEGEASVQAGPPVHVLRRIAAEDLEYTIFWVFFGEKTLYDAVPCAALLTQGRVQQATVSTRHQYIIRPHRARHDGQALQALAGGDRVEPDLGSLGGRFQQGQKPWIVLRA
jgi:hypothetical protein